MNTYGLSKEEILCALYDSAKPFGLGILHFEPEDMSIACAKSLFSSNVKKDISGKSYYYFDYVKGRLIKTSIEEDGSFDAHLYERDYGEGSAEKAIQAYLEKKRSFTRKTHFPFLKF